MNNEVFKQNEQNEQNNQTVNEQPKKLLKQVNKRQ